MKRPTLRAAVGAGFVLLLINTGYIAAFNTPSIPYMMNVLAHFVGGLALAGAFAWLLTREPELRRPLVVASALFAISIVFALWLVAVGNLREHQWILWAHIGTAVLGVVAVLPYAFGLARSVGRPRTLGLGVHSAAAFAAVLPLAATIYVKAYPNPYDRIVNPTSAPLSMQGEGGGPGSPFFPSSSKTNVGGIIPSNFFMDSAACGECHKDVFDQWNSSAHHFASFNNQFYRKSVEYMQDVVGPQPSKWCAGCHDHAVFFNGRFERPIKEQIDTPEAKAGLACTSCHAITEVRSTMGQGDFTIEYPALHELMTSKNPFIRQMDRFLTYLNPEPHRRTFMKPFMQKDASEYCSACHKVHLDVPVNDYRWFRGFNDYDNWQASGVSGQGARSFYYPPKPLTCVDCHMPLTDSKDPGRHADGKVHNHRFPAANTALPFVNKDEAQMKITKDFLQSGFIKVDIFAASPIDESTEGTRMIRRAQEGPQIMTAFGVGEEAEQHGPIVIRDVGQVAAPLDKAQPILVPGSTVRLDVVVRTVRIGHFFPGGTIDAFDVWLELQGKDADGRMVFWSGAVHDDGKGPVEEGAHFYRALQLDGKGNPIDKRNAWQARSVQYVRLIPPGAADVAHYRVKIPKDARGPITFTAKLNYRKFAHFYTRFAYAGQPKPGQDASLIGKAHNSLEYSFDKANIPKNVSGEMKDEIPNLPIIELATATVSLPVGDGKTPTTWTPVIQKADRERWNDWGIGMLLQGDLKGAEYAFKTVTQAEPGYADGWLNVARALIQEGETEAAKPYIQKALDADPSLGRIYFFRAMIEKADGDYPVAIASLRRVVQQYPRDRVALNQLARILFLSREYQESLKVLEEVYRIDPEDLQLHYTAMLAHRGLGNTDAAAREEKLFQRFKAEESAQAITGDRRLAKPEENNERQQIHEHESIPLPAADRSKAILTSKQTKSNARTGGNN
jgi:tetratricopeptide (TPR) repeat protein